MTELCEVVRIGTRALISISGKPVLVTHWDGYPSSLGLDLLSCDKSLRNIIEVAENRTIDAAHISILKEPTMKGLSNWPSDII